MNNQKIKSDQIELLSQFSDIQKTISYLFTLRSKYCKENTNKLNDLLTIQSFLLRKSFNIKSKKKVSIK